MNDILLTALRCALVIAVLMTAMPYLTWFERRAIGRLQVRYGPNRVGPVGLLQPLADGLKLFFKEDVIPARADRPLYLLAPAIALFAALAAFAVIPLGESVTPLGFPLKRSEGGWLVSLNSFSPPAPGHGSPRLSVVESP